MSVIKVEKNCFRQVKILPLISKSSRSSLKNTSLEYIQILGKYVSPSSQYVSFPKLPSISFPNQCSMKFSYLKKMPIHSQDLDSNYLKWASGLALNRQNDAYLKLCVQGWGRGGVVGDNVSVYLHTYFLRVGLQLLSHCQTVNDSKVMGHCHDLHF